MTTPNCPATPPEAAGHAPAPAAGRPEVREFDVRCVTDVEAPDPVQAAREAKRSNRAPGPPAGVFIVTELRFGPGAQWRVDLDDFPGGEPEVLRTREEAGLIAGTGLDAATGPFSPDAITRIRGLHEALAKARQALTGDSDTAGYEALYGLGEAAAAFIGSYLDGRHGVTVEPAAQSGQCAACRRAGVALAAALADGDGCGRLVCADCHLNPRVPTVSLAALGDCRPVYVLARGDITRLAGHEVTDEEAERVKNALALQEAVNSAVEQVCGFPEEYDPDDDAGCEPASDG